MEEHVSALGRSPLALPFVLLFGLGAPDHFPLPCAKRETFAQCRWHFGVMVAGLIACLSIKSRCGRRNDGKERSGGGGSREASVPMGPRVSEGETGGPVEARRQLHPGKESTGFCRFCNRKTGICPESVVVAGAF